MDWKLILRIAAIVTLMYLLLSSVAGCRSEAKSLSIGIVVLNRLEIILAILPFWIRMVKSLNYMNIMAK